VKGKQSGEMTLHAPRSTLHALGMPSFFADRVVLITGASSGIGRALALRLGQDGAKVGLVARRRELLEELAARINDLPSTLHAPRSTHVAVADVTKRDEMQAAAQAIRAALGPIDLLIANAGVGTPTLLDPVNIHDVERTIQVNLLGAIYAVEAVLPEMLRRKSGHLVAISSLAAFKGLPGESAYCASKAAVNAYFEGLRIQARAHRIRVTIACPGFVQTPMTSVIHTPMPFLMTAEKAAEHILWAIRKRKKLYRFPRRTSWLMRLTSWLPDWLVARSMKSYNASINNG
jgi:NADP-dependent 3-hydroxy acid dehydrogenase YdfG